MTPTRQQAEARIRRRAMHAAQQLAQLILDGSREYETLRVWLDEYVTYNHSADLISQQTDSVLGDFEGSRENG